MTNYVITYRCDIKCQLYRCALSGAEQAIAGIPEPRQDVTVVVELAVERGGEDGDVGVGLEHATHALGRRDEAKEADALGAACLSALTASAAEPPVASMGSSTKKSRASS